MIINSVSFWLFFICVLVVYYGVYRKTACGQNITLLLASYVFYGMVDWRMCLLLGGATFAFYGLGIAVRKNISVNPKRTSFLTSLGVCIGVGLLAYFKYMNFFLDQFNVVLELIGLNTNWNSFRIIMPLGISFFTFKLIAYIIEVHRGNMFPSKDPVAFGVYIAFFPTIMSGPIDNPAKFIPQLREVRIIDYLGIGEAFRRIIWGMFLKMCIADQISGYTSAVLGNYEHHNATSIVLASFLYSVQIYTDFAGYSEMAIGASRLLGLSVMENFHRPYFACSITDFWKRWHISLTQWLTNYVYITLGGNRCSMLKQYRNIMVTFIVSGFWHGANWTFVLWGCLHGVYQIIEKYFGISKIDDLTSFKWKKIIRIIITFALITFNWVLFQANSIQDFFGTVSMLFSGFAMPYTSESLNVFTFGVLSILILLFKEIKDEREKDWHFLHSRNVLVNTLSFVLLVVYILYAGQLDGGQFIYFQF